MNLLKNLFAACAWMHAFGCLTDMTQIYAWTHLSGVVKITHFVRDDVLMSVFFF